MKELSSEELLKRNDVIKLRHRFCCEVSDSTRKHIWTLMWYHDDHKIRIEEITNENLKNQENLKPYLTNTYKYILLNPDHEDYNILLEFRINDDSKLYIVLLRNSPRGKSLDLMMNNEVLAKGMYN